MKVKSSKGELYLERLNTDSVSFITRQFRALFGLRPEHTYVLKYNGQSLDPTKSVWENVQALNIGEFETLTLEVVDGDQASAGGSPVRDTAGKE